MNKALIIGCYREQSGSGAGYSQYVLAMDAVGIPVACRPLLLNRSGAVHPRIAQLEEVPADDADVVLHMMPPPMLDYGHQFKKNVCLFFGESSDYRENGWSKYLQVMDGLWVPHDEQRWAIQKSGVGTHIYVVPVPADLSRYQVQPTKIPRLTAELDGRFAFYAIGEWTRRKNWGGLLKAYHAEFGKNDPVALVIKTSVPGLPPEPGFAKVREYIAEVKRGLKLYNNSSLYQDELVITEQFTDEQMIALHHTCDCYVSTSFSEGWGLPCMDALSLGKTPIVSDCGGHRAILGGNVGGWLVPTKEVLCFGAVDSGFPELHTVRETWHEIDLLHLRKIMRLAYEDADLRRRKAAAGIERSQQFSLTTVGNQIRSLLDVG